MSFSSEVKNELALHIPTARHCQMAELSAIFQMSQVTIKVKAGRVVICLATENLSLARKYFTLLKKTFNIVTDVLAKVGNQTKNRSYYLVVSDQDAAKRIIDGLKLSLPLSEQVALLASKSCCKRAYLRGAFLSVGSISDPSGSYHFEMVCNSLEQAALLKRIISSFDIDEGLEAKITGRKRYHIVYIKEGAQIVNILNIMGAHVSLMELENLRIVKEMRNSINRRVNCETANLNKTVSAAVRQIEDIKYIRDTVGLSQLKDSLVEIAELRLEYPDLSLKELGELLDPPVGKSGVNHRLRKLSEYAEELRGQ